MKYRLMRINEKRGNIFGEVTFDLWNHEFEVGYEIKINIYRYHIYLNDILRYCHKLVGYTYDISKWDKIIRDIKQNKIDWSLIK